MPTEPRSHALVLSGARVVTMDPERRILDADVVVEGGRIQSVEKTPREKRRRSSERRTGSEKVRTAIAQGLAKLKPQGGGSSGHATRALLLPEPASVDFIRWLHREFYRDAAPEMLRIQGAGTEFTMQPGTWRSSSEHDVAVVHCPRSNAYVGCGIAPLRELRAAGLRVGVGTDGVSSTPSYDYFDELRAVVMMARARERRPDAMTAAEALELGTLGGAQALGLDAEIGSLADGKRADLAIVSLAGSPYSPVEEPAGAVVFGGSPERVLATFVDGEPRYEKGGMEWHELTAAAHSARRAMLAVPPAAEPVVAAPLA